MEPTGRRVRRAFTAEYKAEVVALCHSSGKTTSAVAQAEIDSGRRDGLTTAEREEFARLRKENRVLREERDILKRATVFFAKETR